MMTMNMHDIQNLIAGLRKGEYKALARSISIVENETDGYEEILSNLRFEHPTQIIGITGPPGAGKSTLLNALTGKLQNRQCRTGIIAIDPTSPFNHGALLGDRLRMYEHFNNPNVFIRSLATRGSLGGISSKTMEIADVMKTAGFDYIFVETAGVGQSEIEIVGLADTTVVVLVPEAGDEIQTMKAGIMEIADIFVVNKSDRDGADIFAKNLCNLIHSKQNTTSWQIPVIKTVATKGESVSEIVASIHLHQTDGFNEKKLYLLTEKAYRLIQSNRMKDVDKKALQQQIFQALNTTDFNLYTFVKSYVR